MPHKIFVNLPVRDLPKARRFYEAIGFSINERFADDTAACVVVSDSIFLMAMVRDRFASYAPLPVAETRETTSCLIALSCDDRAAVDRMTEAAIAAGGQEPKPANDMGFLYQRSFQDPDGNVFEPFWMDPAATAG